jgi:hypothetical protein
MWLRPMAPATAVFVNRQVDNILIIQGANRPDYYSVKRKIRQEFSARILPMDIMTGQD